MTTSSASGPSALQLPDWVEVIDTTARTPVIVHAPHGGTAIPELALGEFVGGAEAIAAEVRSMTDHHVDEFTGRALRDAPASAVINRLSRLVVDVERFPGPEEEKNAVGMGVLYTHGSQRQRIRVIPDDARGGYLAFFDEYSATLTRLVEQALAAHGRAIIVDVHSYNTSPDPHELHTDEPRPELCVGYEDFHISANLREAVADAFGGYEQGDNQTFHGAYVPLRHYQQDARVQSVMLELRRDQYMDETTGEIDGAAAERFGGALAALLTRLNER